ncbi:MAG: hypothetical protein M0P64_03935 [Candidatus Pacebacteria bacterium]|jgi:hypothetical protein|nr:hypothetical protein [Candidatus Paceibacterota bacterium]
MSISFSVEQLSLFVNIGTFIVALTALSSIKVAKDSIQISAKRDSVKYASDLVKFYLKDFVDASTSTYRYKSNINYKKSEFDTSKGMKEFTIEEFREMYDPAKVKEILSINLEQDRKNVEMLHLTLAERNLLETFSTPFISGVADEEIAFGSVGVSFCHSVENNWVEYCIVRTRKAEQFSYFQNTIKLYNIWNNRIKKFQLENNRADIEAEILRITNIKVKPIGT